MPAFPDRESTLLSKLYQSAPWTAKLHKTTGEESGDGATRVTSDSVPPVNDIGQAVGEDLVSTTGTRTCYYTLISSLTLTVLSSHVCDTPVLTTSAIDSPITCIKTS